MPESFVQSSLARFLAKGTLVVLIVVLRLEDSQVAAQRANTHESTCSTSEHCLSNKMSEDADDTAILLQSGRLEVDRLGDRKFEEQGRHSEAETEASTITTTGTNSRNIVALLDGSGWSLGANCTWPANEACQSNLQSMYFALLNIDNESQIVHYEVGVGASEGDSFNSGHGTRKHAYNVYDWLSANYKEGDMMYLFGFSRGTLSARIVQGMLKCVGLAKPEYIGEAKDIFEKSEGDCSNAAKDFKDSHKSRSVKVKFMGFFDAVMRTLFLKSRDYIKGLMMTMTDVVEEFRHAIALDDTREHFACHELQVSSSTNATQVWFPGTHDDVGGGLRSVKLSHIALGWMAEEAMSSGLLLPNTFLPSLEMDAMQDSYFTRADMLVSLASAVGIRNPVKCRKQLFDSAPILVHQSVKDRMDHVKGWVPLAYCCPEMKKGIEDYSITWVEDTHYKSRKNIPSERPPVWIKLTFGAISGAACHETFGASEYYVLAQNWLSTVDFPESSETKGCCEKASLHAKHHNAKSTWHGGYWSGYYLCNSDFEEHFIMLPYDAAVADGVHIQVWEDDVIFDDYVGSVWIPYSEMQPGLKTYEIQGDNQGKLQVKVETYNDDYSVQGLLGGNASAPAQCQWLLTHSGKGQEWLCGKDQPWKVIDSILSDRHVYTPDTCPLFLEDITSGM